MVLKIAGGLVFGQRGNDPTVRKIARYFYSEGIHELFDAVADALVPRSVEPPPPAFVVPACLGAPRYYKPYRRPGRRR
jgi:hypothetical protein